MSQVLVHVVNTAGVVTPTRTGQETTYPVTTYEDFPFNSFAKIGNRYYAAGPSGLFEIEQPQEVINWTFSTGYLDFNSDMLKRVSDFYIAMRSKADLTLSVQTDEGTVYDYPVSPLDIETLFQRRTILGKGLRGRYWKFTLSGTEDFDFDAFMVTMFDTNRRV